MLPAFGSSSANGKAAKPGAVAPVSAIAAAGGADMAAMCVAVVPAGTKSCGVGSLGAPSSDEDSLMGVPAMTYT